MKKSTVKSGCSLFFWVILMLIVLVIYNYFKEPERNYFSDMYEQQRRDREENQ